MVSSAVNTNTEAALDEAGKVVKKQRLCAAKVNDAIDKLIKLAKDAREQAAAGSGDAIKDLLAKAEKLGIAKDMNSSTKDLHSSIGKLGKVRSSELCGRSGPTSSLCDCACCCAGFGQGL